MSFASLFSAATCVFVFAVRSITGRDPGRGAPTFTYPIFTRSSMDYGSTGSTWSFAGVSASGAAGSGSTEYLCRGH